MDANKILIVDDYADTVEVIAVVLSPSFQCKTVGSREEALSEIKAGFLPACVLMDYMMPGMSLENILRKSKPWGLNVVLMTGHDEAADRIFRKLQLPSKSLSLLTSFSEL
jgi:CheY-like chemotaxis protein